MQDNVNNDECIPDCRSEHGSDEPEVMINVTSPPEENVFIASWSMLKANMLKVISINREDSVVIMDVWDFAGTQQLGTMPLTLFSYHHVRCIFWFTTSASYCKFQLSTVLDKELVIFL